MMKKTIITGIVIFSLLAAVTFTAEAADETQTLNDDVGDVYDINDESEHPEIQDIDIEKITYSKDDDQASIEFDFAVSAMTNSVAFCSGATYNGALNFEGNICSEAVYDKELSSDEVSAIYNNGHPVDLRTFDTVSNLKLYAITGDRDYWTGSAISARDQAGSYNGTSVNMEEADIQEDSPYD